MKILFLLFTFLLFTANIAAQTSAKDEAALKSLISTLADAQRSFDAAALDRIFTADYIEISPAGEFDPREKVLGFYAPDKKPAGYTSPSVELSEYSIREYGKFAVVIVKFTYTMMVDGKITPSRSMRATLVCRSEKGVWKIASAQYTGVRPPSK